MDGMLAVLFCYGFLYDEKVLSRLNAHVQPHGWFGHEKSAMALGMTALKSMTVTDLAVRRGDRVLFSDLTFTVNAGQGCIVRGGNGVGKTSFLQVLAGVLRPHAGGIQYHGGDNLIPSDEWADHILYCGHKNGLAANRSVLAELRFQHAWFGGGDLDRAVDALSLGAFLHLPCRVLSAGQQRRVALAKLFMISRPLWILDEPFAPLDVDAQDVLRDHMTQHTAAGGMVVMAAHGNVGLDWPVLDVNTVAV